MSPKKLKRQRGILLLKALSVSGLLVVLFKMKMVLVDHMRTGNSGVALLEKWRNKSMERIDKKQIKPYLQEPRAINSTNYLQEPRAINSLNSLNSTNSATTCSPMTPCLRPKIINVATIVLSAPKNQLSRTKLRAMSLEKRPNEDDVSCLNMRDSDNITSCLNRRDTDNITSYKGRSIDSRKPWIKQSIIFLLGAVEDESVQHLIQEENRMFGDILQISVKDSYGNLPFKSIAGLEYVMEEYQNTDVIIKLDDDLIIHEDALRESLLSLYPFSGDTIYCYQLLNTSPWKRKQGYFGLFDTDNLDKLVVDHETWPADKYPDHCLGWVYALTPETANKILDMVDYTPRHRTDDLYMTGFLRTNAAVRMEMLSTSPILHSWVWKYIISRCRFLAWAYHHMFYDVAMEQVAESTDPLFMVFWNGMFSWNFLNVLLVFIKNVLQIPVEQGACYGIAVAFLHNKLDKRNSLKIFLFLYMFFL